MQDLIRRLIKAANAFDVDEAVALFAPEAVIEDPSAGGTYAHTAGIRTYFERFFVGYKTVSKILSIEEMGDHHAVVRLDFTGDFGHETGVLDITTGDDGLIIGVAADLD